MYMKFLDIHAEQRKPLDYKIQTAVDAIAAGFNGCQSRASLAFSVGKDSTVLWHLIREHFPKEAAKMLVIFGNTGIEYPESLTFARELGDSWGGENFIEATPGLLKKDSLKYEAQSRLLEHLICYPYSRHTKKTKGGVLMSKRKYTAEEKYRAVMECGNLSIRAVALQKGIGATTLREWIANYESMGMNGLQDTVGRKLRTEVEKRKAVLAYLESRQSLEDVCKKNKIGSKTQLREWIKQYNRHENLETTTSGGGIFMTKGRAVTFEEKVEIVEFCIASG